MPRPHRPNPYTGERKRIDANGNAIPRERRPWLATHVPQETRAEAKRRKWLEAEERAGRKVAA
jgi:hypothetical protein